MGFLGECLCGTGAPHLGQDPHAPGAVETLLRLPTSPRVVVKPGLAGAGTAFGKSWELCRGRRGVSVVAVAEQSQWP